MRIEWALKPLMRAQNVGPTELAARLATSSAPRSKSQIHRLVATAPKRADFDLLAALCGALRCKIGELCVLHDTSTEADDANVSHDRPPRYTLDG